MYGYYPETCEVCRYDSEQFITYRDTAILDAMRDYLVENGEDTYSVYNDYMINYFSLPSPVCENGVIYMPVIVYIPKEPAEDGEAEESGYRKDCYLATFDLNSSDHHWQFAGMTTLPDEFWKDDAAYLTPAVLGGKLVCIGDSVLLEEDDAGLPMYSYDLDTKEWTEEPDLPYVADCLDCAQHNGSLYVMFGCDPDTSLSKEERILSGVWRFDGEKWEQKRDDLKYVGRFYDYQGYPIHTEAITAVKNGLIFISASVDGGGNMFLYNTDTDNIEPLYYTVFDTLSDARLAVQSCVTTRDGIYYIYGSFDDNNMFWKLCMLPLSSGAYEDPYADIILGDANLDGKVDIRDVTAIQRHIAEINILTGEALIAADINGDGLDITDATSIQCYLAEFETPYPIGERISN